MEHLVIKLLILSLAVTVLLVGLSVFVGVYYVSTQQDKCGLLVDKIRHEDRLNAFKYCIDSTKVWE